MQPYTWKQFRHLAGQARNGNTLCSDACHVRRFLHLVPGSERETRHYAALQAAGQPRRPMTTAAYDAAAFEIYKRIYGAVATVRQKLTQRNAAAYT